MSFNGNIGYCWCGGILLKALKADKQDLYAMIYLKYDMEKGRNVKIFA